MLKIKVDKDGSYLETIMVNSDAEVSEYLVEPWDNSHGFFMPRYDFHSMKWVEGLSDTELEVAIGETIELSNHIPLEEKLTQTEDMLLTTAIAVADSYEETDSNLIMLMDAIAQVYEELQLLKESLI